MKKVIVIGLGEDFVNFYSKRFPFGCFDIICASDFDEDLKQNAKLIRTQFRNMDYAVSSDYDYIIISSKTKYDIYYEKLIVDYSVEKGKILAEEDIKGFTVDDSFCYNEFRFSFGDLNCNKYFYIVRPTYSIGLFACVGRTLAECAYATSKGWIPIVDMQNYPNMYLSDEELYLVNSWNKFFLQPCYDYTLTEVYSSKNVIFGDVRNARKTEKWKNGGDLYKHELWNKFIKLNSQMKIELAEEEKKVFAKANGKEILGVLLRGTDYTSLQPENHPIQPSSADMIKIVFEKMKQWNCKYVFLSTEDKGILRSFQAAFGTRLLFTNQVRYENTGNKYLASIKTERDNDEMKRGKEYLFTIMLLSKCDYLITSKCGGGNVVKMINGDQYKEIITIDKGIYGKNNIVTTVFEAKNVILIGDNKNLDKIAEKISNKYNKKVYVYTNNNISTKFEKIDNIQRIEKPYGIIVEENKVEIEKISNNLRNKGIAFIYYTFVLNNIIDIGILKLMNICNYHDENNNEISISNDTSEKIKIRYHNNVTNSVVRLGKVKVTESLSIDIYGNFSNVEIGNNTSVYSGVMQVSTGGKIIIGEDCLISYSIGFFQCDMHSIFDLESKKRINYGKNIVIGNHVWIGREVMLLGGAYIPDNCVIGSRTVTSAIFKEKNVIVAGQPGKIIRRNIVWARDEAVLDYEEYDMCNDKAALKYIDIEGQAHAKFDKED